MNLFSRVALNFFLLFFMLHYTMTAQIPDCSLDIGGKDTEVIIKVFQLNEKQQSLLDGWKSELNLQVRVIEDNIDQLLDQHPQSTEADLMNLAKKYTRLKDSLVQISNQYDQMLLGVFNEKQYEFYTELCREAIRRPLTPVATEQEEEEPEEN